MLFGGRFGFVVCLGLGLGIGNLCFRLVVGWFVSW